ncbi:hypothetical protein FQN57_002870 [Myotisia sp. PD_48]|nr:hypothetical protein FQN57_002870 [Myotisia sp. PD_48]
MCFGKKKNTPRHGGQNAGHLRAQRSNRKGAGPIEGSALALSELAPPPGEKSDGQDAAHVRAKGSSSSNNAGATGMTKTSYPDSPSEASVQAPSPEKKSQSQNADSIHAGRSSSSNSHGATGKTGVRTPSYLTSPSEASVHAPSTKKKSHSQNADGIPAGRSSSSNSPGATGAKRPSYLASPSEISVQGSSSGTKSNGLQTLFTPSMPEVDIVFLHGLTGHPKKTFFNKSARINWPEDLLPQDIPYARILSFGYDANVVKFASQVGQNTLEGHASDLVNDLARLRRNGDASRMIIFVAHSLGGLVVKEAMALSEQSADVHLRRIQQATAGIAFLGTPHRGADIAPAAQAIANIADLFGKSANSAILEPLKRNSQLLAMVENSFANWIRKKKDQVDLTCFYEELEIPGFGMVVQRESATLAGWPQMSIHANHRDMARFSSPDDQGYQRICGELKRWTQHLGNHTDSGFSGSDIQDVESAQSAWVHQLGFQQEEVLKVSNPASIYQGQATEESVEWFTRSPEFKTWKDTENSPALLWVHSDSEQGETALMFYLVTHLPCFYGYPTNCHITAVFCSNGYAEDLMLVSLVSQLVRYTTQADDVLTAIKHWRSSQTQRDLTKNLWGLLEKLFSETTGREMVFLVDRIDKLQQSVCSSFLRNLKAFERKVGQRAKLRVLLSSRSDARIRDTLSHYSEIEPGKEWKECLETLFFREWNARETRIEMVDGAEWLSSHEEYLKWRDNPSSSFLWIEGKPGSGKSTLSKQIAQKLNRGRRTHNRQASSDTTSEIQYSYASGPQDYHDPIVAEFYFSFRGGISETSHELMLRSIVYQIWSQNQKLFLILRDRYRERKRGSSNNAGNQPMWRYEDLKSALNSLHRINFPLNVFIVLDGMDESDDFQRKDVLCFLSRLAAKSSDCIIKVSVASRPENGIRPVAEVYNIVLQDLNMEDIRKTVERNIDNIGRLCGLTDTSSQQGLSKIKHYIIENSHGVFLWVALVLQDLNRHVRKGAFTIASLEKRMHKLPRELGGQNGFYRAIVDSLVRHLAKAKHCEAEELDEALHRGRRILAWVTFPKRPISADEMRDVLATDASISSDEFEENRPIQLERGILSYCGTLVEVQSTQQVVQLIHQTAREFLLDRGSVASPYDLDELSGDIEIAATCCRHLKIAFLADCPQMNADDKFSHVGRVIKHLSKHCLLNYSLPNFMTHLDHLGDRGEEIRTEFESFLEILRSRPRSYATLLLSPWAKSLTRSQALLQSSDELRAIDCIRAAAGWATSKQAREILYSLQPDFYGRLRIEAQLGH